MMRSWKRRDFMKQVGTAAIGLASSACLLGQNRSNNERPGKRPNILFAFADDQSWLHTSATGDPIVKTPACDRVAREGTLFTHH